VVGDAGGVVAEDAGGGRGDHDEVAGLAEAGVGDRLGPVEEGRAGRLGGQRRERQGPDEAGRPGGEDGHHVGAGVDEAPADLDGLVGGDPAGDAQDDAPAGERLQRCYLIDRSTTSGRSKTILPASISSREIDRGLRDSEVTWGGTIVPSPSPSWLK